MNRSMPTTPSDWLDEIRLAIADTRETGMLADSLGQPITDDNLFHLAPLICLKFRGLDYRNEDLQRKVTEGALTNYVANTNTDGVDHGLKQRPLMSFALCYLTAHLVFDFIDEQEAESALNYCDEHLN